MARHGRGTIVPGNKAKLLVGWLAWVVCLMCTSSWLLGLATFGRSGSAGRAGIISVVLFTQNSVDDLDPAISAIEAQDYEGVEIIISDDGSTDGTVERAEALAAAKSHVTLIKHAATGGAGVALNSGIHQATGEWVMLLDAADRLAPRAFSGLMALATSRDIDVVVGKTTVAPGGPAETNGLDTSLASCDGRDGVRLLGQVTPVHKSALFRKALADGLGGIRETVFGAHIPLFWRLVEEEFGVFTVVCGEQVDVLELHVREGSGDAAMLRRKEQVERVLSVAATYRHSDEEVMEAHAALAGAPDGVLAEVEAVLARHPTDHRLLLVKGLIERGRGDRAAAVKTLEEAYKQSRRTGSEGDKWQIAYEYGVVLFEQSGSAPKARIYLRKAMRRHPDLPLPEGYSEALTRNGAPGAARPDAMAAAMAVGLAAMATIALAGTA